MSTAWTYQEPAGEPFHRTTLPSHYTQPWPPTNPHQLCSSPRFNCQIQCQRKCCPVPPMMARGVELSTRHWCHSTPGERIRKAEGKTASAECRSWLVWSRPKGTQLTIYQKLKYVSLNRSHNSSFSLNMCVTAILSCLFSARHTHCLVTLQGLPSPLALRTQLSYRGSGSHLPGSLLSIGRRGHLQYWCTWRRWEGKLRYPADIHLYLWAKWWASEIHRQPWYKGKE